MAGLLSHALAAMAFSALLGMVFGLPAISFGIFVAGVIAMLIEQDYDELSPTLRTPITHSILFGTIWVVLFSVTVWSLTFYSRTAVRQAQELTLALIAAYTTHLVIDAFTKEGIYLVPKGIDARRWIKGLLRGEGQAWSYWYIFRIEKIGGRNVSRANEDPILNAAISLPSLMIIIALVAAMPPPV